MNVYRNWIETPPGIDRAVTVGNFDGVHQGHRAVMERLKAVAGERGETAMVVTFKNHTSEIVRRAWPPLLMDVDERLAALAEIGIEEVLLLEFTPELSRTPAEDFLRRLVAHGARSFVAGHDFRCGAEGKGDTGYLLAFASRNGINAEVVPAVLVGGEIVSSTRIRRLISEGKVEEARILLGRPFRMGGVVGHGEERGRTLGFPTANLAIEPHRLIPRYGVYLVKALIDGREPLFGLGNVGVKPTFREQPPLIEVFLFDFNEDIYGRHMEVDFLAFLRPERRFGSADELAAQIRRDVAEGRGLLAQKRFG